MRRTVLHLIDQSGPGGAQTVFTDLVGRLDRSRWRSLACVPEKGWVADTVRAGGLEPTFTPVKRGPFDFRYLARIHDLVRAERVDVIHAHLLGPGVYGGLVGLFDGVPVVTTFHGHVDVAPDERFRGVKFRVINRAAGTVVFVSEHLREFFLSVTGLDAGRTAVVYNGIDFSALQPDPARSFRAELGVGSDERLIGAVGHIRPPKAYDVFLRAAAGLRRVSARYRFVIVGRPEGDLLPGLEALRDELGLREAVTFAGFRTDLHRVMSALDAYAITSSTEGFSLSAVHAMACGVPVVATRCGGPEEIVTDGETGRLVAVGDPVAIAAALREVCESPALARRLAERAGPSVRERFSIERMLAAYEAIYERAAMSSRYSAS